MVELLQLVHGENVPWKQQLLGGAWRKYALIGGVVDREHGCRAEQIGIGCVRRAQVNRNQRRLPIVHMKDVGHAELL